MSRIALVLVPVMMALVACSDTPVQPDVPDVPAPTFVQIGPAGNGVEFISSPYHGINITDEDGDWCRTRNELAGTEGDASDWIRTDKKGNTFIHIVDAPATIRIELASGDTFTGEGRWNLEYHMGFGTAVSKTVGTVSDGVQSFYALCNYTWNNWHERVNVVDVK